MSYSRESVYKVSEKFIKWPKAVIQFGLIELVLGQGQAFKCYKCLMSGRLDILRLCIARLDYFKAISLEIIIITSLHNLFYSGSVTKEAYYTVLHIRPTFVIF